MKAEQCGQYRALDVVETMVQLTNLRPDHGQKFSLHIPASALIFSPKFAIADL